MASDVYNLLRDDKFSTIVKLVAKLIIIQAHTHTCEYDYRLKLADLGYHIIIGTSLT